jgi:hypothetical protein
MVSWGVFRRGRGVEEAVGPEELGAVAHSFHQVDAHGRGREPEVDGDFRGGESVHVTEQHHLTATLGQRLERGKHRFVALGDKLLLAERIAVCDSTVTDTLLALPL